MALTVSGEDHGLMLECYIHQSVINVYSHIFSSPDNVCYIQLSVNIDSCTAPMGGLTYSSAVIENILCEITPKTH